MISCDVIQDLLPLYADGQASDASIKLIAEHIKHCDVCRKTESAMRSPIEQLQDSGETDYIVILKKQKRKNRNRILLACFLTALLCLVGWWLYMESHFTVETPVLVSNAQDEILKELPMLELSTAEKDFAQLIPTIPTFSEKLQPSEIKTHSLDTVTSAVSDVLPKDALLREVSTIGSGIYIDYLHDAYHVILVYSDPNQDSVIDSVSKTIAINADSGDVDIVYSVQHACVLNWTQYEKYVSRHIWFGFLDKEIFQ